MPQVLVIELFHNGQNILLVDFGANANSRRIRGADGIAGCSLASSQTDVSRGDAMLWYPI